MLAAEWNRRIRCFRRTESKADEMRRTTSGIPLLVACAAVLSLLASCAPTYDNIADQMLADTQKQADDGLLKLETLATIINSMQNNHDPDAQKVVADAKKQASFASNTDFYDQLQSSLSALETRMTAISDLSTPKLNTALTDLEKNVAQVRSTHATENLLGAEYVKASRQLLDQQFKALTVYELTIKGGSKPN
jgi:hypothetical protein